MRWTVVGVMLLNFALAVDGRAQEADARHDVPGERFPRRWNREGAGFGSRPWGADPRVERNATAQDGYVFIDGQYVPPPYEIRREASAIQLNGRVLQFEVDSHNQSSMRPRSPRELAEQLELGSVVVVFEGEPIVVLTDRFAVELLRALSNPDSRSAAVQDVLSMAPPAVQGERWQKWLASYEPPQELQVKAQARVAEVDALHQQGNLVIAANRRLNTWAYPLTVFGMLMSVVSFGHLLQFPPRGSADLIPSRRRAELCRATVIFLAMVVILSALDLVWTLLTSQAGQMRELNPIGNYLLDTPWMLSIFKATATLLSCSLLLYLRRHPRAQLASWWLCLVCTLLTFRWLVLNSMFVA